MTTGSKFGSIPHVLFETYCFIIPTNLLISSIGDIKLIDNVRAILKTQHRTDTCMLIGSVSTLALSIGALLKRLFFAAIQG